MTGVLPSSVAAEVAIIAACVDDAAAYDAIAVRLRSSHFSEPILGRIWDEIGDIIAKGETPNALVVSRRLASEQAFEDFGGARKLVELGSSPYRSIGLTSVESVIDASRRRQVLRCLQDGAAAVVDPARSLDDALQGVEEGLSDSVSPDLLQKTFTFANAFTDALDRVERLRRGEAVAGVDLFGFQDFNDLIPGGLMPGDYLLLAGRPSMGKTALALAVARRAAQAGHGVLFISREMQIDQLMPRMLADLLFEAGGKATFEDIRLGRVSDDDLQILRRLRCDIEGWPLVITAPEELGSGQIAPLIRRFKRSFARRGAELKLVIIDYLGLVDPPLGRPNREQEVSGISKAIKMAAASGRVSIIALSQLSRAVEQRDDKHPQLSDLRDSGTLEQDADYVVFVYRDEYYLARAEPDAADVKKRPDWEADMAAARNRIDIYTAKARQGEVRRRKSFFFGAHQAVRNSDYFQSGAWQ